MRGKHRAMDVAGPPSESQASPPTEDSAPKPMAVPPKAAPRGWWAKTKHLVIHNILHLDDTPHRIAWGVFWGFLVGATPTIGLQMIIYVAIATVVRANKVSGILPVWLSNPLTAVPLYYSNWMIGHFLLTGQTSASESSKQAIALVTDMLAQDQPLLERLFSAEFWSAAFKSFTEMGVELWVGSLLVGVVLGGLGYWATYRGVIAFRRRGRNETPHADS